MTEDDQKQCRNRALNLLARREHSQQELSNKLLAKGFEPSVIMVVVKKLALHDLLSDQRFAELYIEQRARKGYGAMRIQQELQQRGVKVGLIEDILTHIPINWSEHAEAAWEKYLRTHVLPGDVVMVQMQRKKFLYGRGFG